MKANNIIIFSKPIQTGKTTELLQFVKDKNNIAGILTPDSNDKRMLFDVKLNQYYPFELDNDSTELSVKIGRFLFAENAFHLGRKIILEANEPEFLIIDEVGKLEIEQHQGFEPAISQIIQRFNCSLDNNILLLVIRDTLLQKALEKYQLQQAKIIDSLIEL